MPQPDAAIRQHVALTSARRLIVCRPVALIRGTLGIPSRDLISRIPYETIGRLRTTVGELTMDNELLYSKIDRLEAGGAGGPFGARRSKR